MKWLEFKKDKPVNRQRVLVYYYNEYHKGRTTIAEYIEEGAVLAEDYLDDDCPTAFFEDTYNEEKDCYFAPSGFYESGYEPEISYFISEKIIYWMPLPCAPQEGNLYRMEWKTACPKCLGTTGYYTKNRMSYEQQYEWDGSPMHYTGTGGYTGKIKRCLDCGKIIKQALKEGGGK